MRDRSDGTAIPDGRVSPELRKKLRECLAQLYDNPDAARMVAIDVGLEPSAIDFRGGARLCWESVLNEATKQGRLTDIFERAQGDFPANPDVQDIARQLSEVGLAESASGAERRLVGLSTSPSTRTRSAGSHSVAVGAAEFRVTAPTPLRREEPPVRPVVRRRSTPEPGSASVERVDAGQPGARSSGARFRANRYFNVLAGGLVVTVLVVIGAWTVVVGNQRDRPGASGVRGMVAAMMEVVHSNVAKFDRRSTCPRDMIVIPAGEFRMGSADVEGEIDEHPLHRVRFPLSYCLERTEVSVASYRECVTAGVCTAPDLFNPRREHDSYFCNWERVGAENHPANCVDWWQAIRFCRWIGHDGGARRLPTEAEWEFAARSSENRLYPWGDEPPSETRANLCGSECLPQGVVTIPRWRDRYASTATVTEFLAGATPSGVLNLAGNVAEWVQDQYFVDAYSHVDGNGFLSGDSSDTSGDAGRRVTRGGDWQLGASTAIRATRRSSAAPGTRSATLGFRCARDAP